MWHRRRTRAPRLTPVTFAERIAHTTQLFTVLLAAIGLRCWHLTVVEHAARLDEAERPKIREIWAQPARGLILDRHGNSLALNHEELRCSVLYADLREVPRNAWILRDGQKVRIRARTEYIARLAIQVGKTLGIDPKRVEDQIHAHAALTPHRPYPLHTGLSQEQYYQLKMMERDWPGFLVEAVPKRCYPHGATTAHIVGHLGRIGAEEWRHWKERQELFARAEEGDTDALSLLAQEDHTPLGDLELYAQMVRRLRYRPTDWMGKAGVERAGEDRLRGLCGVERFEADTSGRRLRPLSSPLPAQVGANLTLSISLPMQKEAERLLREAEARPEGHRAPSIAGGGIVVMDPNTGHVLTLAGFPSYDPNLFITRDHGGIFQSLENERWLEMVWEGSLAPAPARGELTAPPQLTWEEYLHRALGREHPISCCLLQAQLGPARQLLEECAGTASPSDEQLATGGVLLAGWPVERGRQLLAYNMIRLLLLSTPPSLIDSPIASLTLGEVRQLQLDWFQVERVVRKQLRHYHHHGPWRAWRAAHQKRWLSLQRQKERSARRPHRPYLELLDAEEMRQSEALYQALGKRWQHFLVGMSRPPEELPAGLAAALIAPHEAVSLQRVRAAIERDPTPCRDLLTALIPYRALAQEPLVGRFPFVRGGKLQTLQGLAAAFHPPFGVGFMRSKAFQQVDPLGSVFKLITAYEALQQSAAQHYGLPQTEGWTIREDAIFHGQRCVQVGTTADGKPIPRIYKGGRLPLTAYRHFGHMDFLEALERSSNPFFALLAVDVLRDPLDLLRASQELGLGSRTGIPLPFEAPGRLPRDLVTNRSGLYEFSMGQHEMRCTPLQTAVMLSALVNGGRVWEPSIELHQPAHVRRTIPLLPAVQKLLIQGMWRVLHGPTGSARNSLVQRDPCGPALRACYARMAPRLIGKTGTAEILESISPDPTEGVVKVKHVWSAMALYPTPEAARTGEDPQLVVIAYLRFGRGGREAAPLAARMAELWDQLRRQNML